MARVGRHPGLLGPSDLLHRRVGGAQTELAVEPEGAGAQRLVVVLAHAVARQEEVVGAQQVVQEVREHFGAVVYETVVPVNIRLSESPSFGKPALLYDIESKGAQAYLALAREVLSRMEAATTA